MPVEPGVSKELKETCIRTFLQTLEEAKKDELTSFVAHRVSREEGWPHCTLPCVNKRKTLTRLMYGLTPFMAILKEAETEHSSRTSALLLAIKGALTATPDILVNISFQRK